MLSDRELENTAAQLADFRTESEQHHKTLTEVLTKHNTLVEDYKRLRSDYEEERDSRERYKQMARGQERNPFVLLLIDGDGYVFDDDLVSGGAEGGQKAAALLNDAVKSSLRSRGLDHCRIMVRVYANLSGLSKALSKVKLAGPEKRSLAPFVASFNRSNDLFDFVDAGDLKENADFKIRAMFRQFAENAQCRHIYFAGCHDVGYLSELTPYQGNRDRLTLIRTPSFHHQFLKLGMRVEDFPYIFRGTPLEDQPTVSSAKTAQPQTLPTSSASTDPATICTFFQKGTCKYGKGCKYLHVKMNANGKTTLANGANAADWRTPRQNSGNEPFQMNNLAKSDNDFMSGHSMNIKPTQLPADLENILPRDEDVPPGNVPVNKDHQRLDAYMQPIAASERAAFQSRIVGYKLCNNHHLKGHCASGENCVYDHRPISASEMKCLRNLNRNAPCPRKGSCRVLNCLGGHICQKPDCRFRGGSNFCKIPAYVHQHDLNLAGYEPAIMPAKDSNDFNDDSETVESGSGRGATTPVRNVSREFVGNENEHESDEEMDGEGALLDLEDGPPD